VDCAARRHCAAGVAVIAALLCGCSIRCEPTGEILWSDTMPRTIQEISNAAEGAMGGLDCEAGWR
jgi:hypothetical protein